MPINPQFQPAHAPQLADARDHVRRAIAAIRAIEPKRLALHERDRLRRLAVVLQGVQDDLAKERVHG